MAALTKDRNTPMRVGGTAREGEADVAAATTIFFGSLIGVNAAGFVVPMSDTAALVCIGIAQEQVINTGANGAKKVRYITGVEAEFENAGGAIVQAGKHALCYAADDQSVTTAAVAVNDRPVGIVRSFTAAKVWVFVDEVLSRAV